MFGVHVNSALPVLALVTSVVLTLLLQESSFVLETTRIRLTPRFWLSEHPILTIRCPGFIYCFPLLFTAYSSFTSWSLPELLVFNYCVIRSRCPSCLKVLFYVYYCVSYYLLRILLMPLFWLPMRHMFTINSVFTFGVFIINLTSSLW